MKKVAGVIFLVLLLLVSWAIAGADEQWEFVERFDTIKLYQAVEEDGDFLPFRAEATLNVSAERIAMALVDIERKNMWAPKLKFTKLHKILSSNSFQYSEYYTTPWPFMDREFLLSGRVVYEPDRIIFRAENSPESEMADEDHVQVDIKILNFEIIPLTRNSSKVIFTFSGDMGGWIPDFVQTIIQKKWPVRFIQALEQRIKEEPQLETSRYAEMKKIQFF